MAEICFAGTQNMVISSVGTSQHQVLQVTDPFNLIVVTMLNKLATVHELCCTVLRSRSRTLAGVEISSYLQRGPY
jgi:hypothetical protein